MPGSPEILCSVVEKTGGGGVAEPAPQASRAAPRCWKTQGRLLLANFLPHSPPRLLQPPSLEGWEKERQFGDYQSHGFHFQGGGWGRLLPGGLSGPLPARLGQRVGLEAWAVGRGGGGRVVVVEEQLSLRQNAFSQGRQDWLRPSPRPSLITYAESASPPAPRAPLGPALGPDGEGPLWLLPHSRGVQSVGQGDGPAWRANPPVQTPLGALRTLQRPVQTF